MKADYSVERYASLGMAIILPIACFTFAVWVTQEKLENKKFETMWGSLYNGIHTD